MKNDLFPRNCGPSSQIVDWNREHTVRWQGSLETISSAIHQSVCSGSLSSFLPPQPPPSSPPLKCQSDFYTLTIARAGKDVFFPIKCIELCYFSITVSLERVNSAQCACRWASVLSHSCYSALCGYLWEKALPVFIANWNSTSWFIM